MQSRRLHRLSRFRRNKRRLRDRLRQRIFFGEDKETPETMEKPRVVVLTGAGISAESGIKTFRAAVSHSCICITVADVRTRENMTIRLRMIANRILAVPFGWTICRTRGPP